MFIFLNFNCGVSLAWISLYLSYLVFTQLLGIIGLCLLPNLGHFQPILQTTFQLPSFLLSFWDCVDMNDGSLLLSPRSLRLCSFFFWSIFSLSVVQIEWILLFCTQVHWFSPVIFILFYWAIYSVFYFCYCIFQFCNTFFPSKIDFLRDFPFFKFVSRKFIIVEALL